MIDNPKIKKKTRLKKILMYKGITQKELSDMTGIKTYKISALCIGKTNNLYLTNAKKIAYALGLTLDDVFGGD
jgi:transcriptional regulator with XRE-family HTH domain